MRKLMSFKEQYDLEIVSYLEYMARYKSGKRGENSVLGWASKFIKGHKLSKNESDMIVNDATTLQRFFDEVFLCTKDIDLSYFNALIDKENPLDEISVASILMLHTKDFYSLGISEKSVIYTSISYGVLCDYVGITGLKKENIKIIDSFEEFLGILESSNIDDSVKWKLMTVAKKYKEIRADITEIVEKVYDSYVKNLNMVEPLIKKCFVELDNLLISSLKNKIMSEINIGVDENSKVCYSLAFFNAVGLFDTSESKEQKIMFVGVFYYYLKNIVRDRPSEEQLIQTFRCLGEPRKLEIIKSLLKSPCNGKELANRLGITQATISHHTVNMVQNSILYLQSATTNNLEYVVNKELIIKHLLSFKELIEANE